MEALKKEYRKTKLNLAIEIARAHLAGQGIKLDTKIKKLVCILYAYGFNPVMSCEGHVPPYTGVDTFRLFWSYIQIVINNRVTFDFDTNKEKGLLRIEAELDHCKVMQKLQTLIDEFNLSHHPFYEKRLELDLLVIDGVSHSENYFSLQHAIEKHYNLHVLICDRGVRGILTMPQELLNDSLRKKFLKRTQHQMELFTKFLEWNAIEHGID